MFTPDVEPCGWLVVVGWYDDGEERIDICGALVDVSSSHDGLCPRHTRGMSFEDYYAPFGPAWEDEQRARY